MSPEEDPSPGLDAAAPEPAASEKRVVFTRTSTPDPVEAEALTRAQAGDHHAFAQLYS